MPEDDRTAPAPAVDPRQARLAQALRANLRRRKAAALPATEPEGDDGAGGR